MTIEQLQHSLIAIVTIASVAMSWALGELGVSLAPRLVLVAIFALWMIVFLDYEVDEDEQ